MKLTKRMGLGGRIPKTSRALSKDNYRPMLTGAMLKIEEHQPHKDALPQKRAVLYATNSYLFVRNVIEGLIHKDFETAAEGPIPRQALQHIEKGVEFEPREDGIRAGLATYDRVYAEGGDVARDYPDYDSLRPPKPERAFRVSINGDFMADLSAALGSPQLVFEFDLDQMTADTSHNNGEKDKTYLRAIVVKPGGSNADGGSEAILMPIRVNG